MPTTRPRHSVTETDELARALDDAARRWPGESRAGLLVRLVGLGHRALRDEDDDEAAARRAAVRRTAGALTGSYPPGALAALREEWPA